MPSANKTVNLELNQWLGNEFPKLQDFVDDNLKIDTEIKNLKDTLGTGLVANNITIADTENKIVATKVEGALLEINAKAETNKANITLLQNADGTLANLQTTNKANLVSAINEVFQNANNGKNTIAAAVGSPLVNADIFSAMGTKIDTLTQSFKTKLTGKGVTVLGTDKMSSLIDKVDAITISSLGGKKWASGTAISSATKSDFVYSNYNSGGMTGFYTIQIGPLDFIPSYILIKDAIVIAKTGSTTITTSYTNYYVTTSQFTLGGVMTIPIQNAYSGGETCNWIAYE